MPDTTRHSAPDSNTPRQRALAAVNLARYRLNDESITSRAFAEMRTNGVCVLPGFITNEAVADIVREVEALAPLAHRSAPRRNPYLTDANGLNTHAVELHDSLEVLAYDHFDPAGTLRSLYECDDVLHFVRRCLGLDVLHRYADPFGALNVSIMRDGDVLDWHFDMTDFVVSIALQSAESGGDFENAANIRGNDNDDQVVAAVLRGDAQERVRIEPMTPGTLMLFNGRRSMHRVTPIKGMTPRFVALLAYDTKPGTDSTDALKLSRYGRLPSGRLA
ncbi:MAG: HalD/BesD family halogenase [Ilumatobacteraceae bacterium]